MLESTQKGPWVYTARFSEEFLAELQLHIAAHYRPGQAPTRPTYWLGANNVETKMPVVVKLINGSINNPEPPKAGVLYFATFGVEKSKTFIDQHGQQCNSLDRIVISVREGAEDLGQTIYTMHVSFGQKDQIPGFMPSPEYRVIVHGLGRAATIYLEAQNESLEVKWHNKTDTILLETTAITQIFAISSKVPGSNKFLLGDGAEVYDRRKGNGLTGFAKMQVIKRKLDDGREYDFVNLLDIIEAELAATSPTHHISSEGLTLIEGGENE